MTNGKDIKFRLTAFYYDTETDSDVEYVEEIDLNLKGEDREEFVTNIKKSGAFESLEKIYGELWGSFQRDNKFYNVLEYGVFREISKDDFDALWLKWKALLKQEKVI